MNTKTKTQVLLIGNLFLDSSSTSTFLSSRHLSPSRSYRCLHIEISFLLVILPSSYFYDGIDIALRPLLRFHWDLYWDSTKIVALWWDFITVYILQTCHCNTEILITAIRDPFTEMLGIITDIRTCFLTCQYNCDPKSWTSHRTVFLY